MPVKEMESIPNKILRCIIGYLPLCLLQECQQVSTTWNKHASYYLENCKKMYGYVDIKETSKSLKEASGSSIYRLVFIMKKHTGPPPTVKEFLTLMKKVPNLRAFDFFNVNPIYFLLYLRDYNVKLSQLEYIKIPPSKWSDVADCYFKVAYKYRKTITCLNMEITDQSYSDFPLSKDFTSYVRDFPNLFVLDIRTSISDCLELEAILDACPNLQELTIEGPFNICRLPDVSNLLIGETGSSADANSPTQYGLHSLKIDETRDNAVLRLFVQRHLPNLRRFRFREHSISTG
jgi:hypothetical protein